MFFGTRHWLWWSLFLLFFCHQNRRNKTIILLLIHKKKVKHLQMHLLSLSLLLLDWPLALIALVALAHARPHLEHTSTDLEAVVDPRSLPVLPDLHLNLTSTTATTVVPLDEQFNTSNLLIAHNETTGNISSTPATNVAIECYDFAQKLDETACELTFRNLHNQPWSASTVRYGTSHWFSDSPCALQLALGNEWQHKKSEVRVSLEGFVDFAREILSTCSQLGAGGSSQFVRGGYVRIVADKSLVPESPDVALG